MAIEDQSLARLFGELPEVVVILDASGNIIWANEFAERLFNRSLQFSIGMSALGFVHGDDLELVLRSLETVQDKEVGNPLEIRVLIDSSWRLVELIGAPVGWFQEGAVLFSIRDLTERRRFEVARDDVARFRSLVHNATTIMMLVSPTGIIDSVSGALTRILGHDPELVEHQPLANIVAPEDHATLEAAITEALRGATATHPVVVGVRLIDHDAVEAISFELMIVNLLDDPTVAGLVVTAHDVSSRVAAELELRSTLSLLNATFDSTADGLLVVDSERRITSFNQQFAEMWHLPEEVLAHRSDIETIAFVVDQLVDPEAFVAGVEHLYAQPRSESKDLIVFRDGRVFERFSKPQFVGDDVVGRVWSFSDVTEQKRLEDDLVHQAFHDALTGLANKALFRDRMNQAIARIERTHKYVAVLFLDLDNFKMINDSLGHLMGDELLVAVAEVLVGCLRSGDTAARLGGDEFAVLIEDADNHDAVIRLADRILAALRKPILVGTQSVLVTASIGITFGVSDSDGEQLLSNADLAMYMAKNQGKNRYEEFQDQMHTAVVTRLELEADLRRAVIGDEFIVHYQPILDLAGGEIVGFEALVRWQHPEKGLLQPADFIPFAEEIGLIDAIDRYVLAEAGSQARSWQEAGLARSDLQISVNLSAREMIDTSIAASVSESLRTSGFEPKNLIIEITESAVMRDLEAAVRNLRALADLGVRVAIDDFGTGYSSLSHLEQLPIDILKIDRSFVSTVAERAQLTHLCRAIVQLAGTLGLTTIAEGVESELQAERLREIGCLLAQGFHLGMPLSAEATGDLLRARLAAPSARPPG
jgi:diguanylate cyclase (GGDEF)-like protein/PAS domain S-box-containing protein